MAIAKIRYIAQIHPDLMEIVPEYLRQRREDLEDTLNFLNSNQIQLAARVIHNIKGNGQSYGFDDLSEYAQKVEELLRAGDVETAKVWVEKCKEYVDSVVYEAA